MNSHQLFDDIDVEINHFNTLYPNIYDDSSSQYYTSDSFNQSFPGSDSKDFNIIHLNIHSVTSHGDEFYSFLENLNVNFESYAHHYTIKVIKGQPMSYLFNQFHCTLG